MVFLHTNDKGSHLDMVEVEQDTDGCMTFRIGEFEMYYRTGSKYAVTQNGYKVIFTESKEDKKIKELKKHMEQIYECLFKKS